MTKMFQILALALIAVSNPAFADHMCGHKGGHEMAGGCGEKGGCGDAGGCGMRKSHGGEPHGMMFLNFADELGLSDGQVAKLNKMRLESEEKMWKLRADKMAKNAEYKKLAHEKKADTKALDALADKIGSIHADIIKFRYTSFASAKGVLNDKQKAKLDEIFKGYHGKPAPEGEDE